MGGRQEVIEAGQWLAEQRKRRGGNKLCPQGLVAKVAQARASDNGVRVEIKQQQLSEIERAREDNDIGPKKGLPHWWRYVVGIVESGELDEAIQTTTAPVASDRATTPTDGEYLIQAPNGDIVGRIVWTKPLN